MPCTEFLKARVSPEIKIRVKAAADREFLHVNLVLKAVSEQGVAGREVFIAGCVLPTMRSENVSRVGSYSVKKWVFQLETASRRAISRKH
jgi:hypothetical protein